MALEFDPTRVRESERQISEAAETALEDHRVHGTSYVFTPDEETRFDHAQVLAEIVHGIDGLDFSDPDVLAGLIRFSLDRGSHYGEEARRMEEFAWR